MWNCRWVFLCVAAGTAGVIFAATDPAYAGEIQITAYLGTNISHDSDVTLSRPDGTNVTFQQIPWDAKPFKMPPYYGLRATYWFDSMPNFGVGVDYTHAKVYAQLGSTVAASGTIAGAPVPSRVLLGSLFSQLELTDGLNLITANAYYRWNPFGNSWRPYVGVGVGAAIPHVEVFQAGYPNTFQYELTGVAVRGIGGLEYQIAPAWSVFSEYQFTYAQVNGGSLVGGGSISTDILSHHFNFGVSYHFH
jgi:lipid A oxidase